MPRLPLAGCFSHENTVLVRSRQLPVTCSSLPVTAKPAFSCHLPPLRPRETIVMRKFDHANENGSGLLLDPARCHVGPDVADVEAFDPERGECKIVDGSDRLRHQAQIPPGLGEPESTIAFRMVRPRAKGNIADRLSVAGSQHQHPLIDLLAGGDLRKLRVDETRGAVVRVR